MNNQVSNSPYPCKELENIRVRRQLLSYLSTDEYPLDINIVHDPVLFMDEAMRYIDHEIGMIRYSKEDANGMLVRKVRECKAELLPESEFDWLKRDERACYYTWLTIRNDTLSVDLSNLSFVKPKKWLDYHDIRLTVSAESSQKRLELIIAYLDLQPVNTSDKIDYLTYIQGIWNKNRNTNKNNNANPFRWLDRKDKDACQWGYEYIRNSFAANDTEPRDKRRQRHDSFEWSYQQLNELNPATADEQYQFIYLFFDILDERDKKDFKEKISRKFAQHKYQKSKQEIPPLNTRMSKETKKQLEKLRKHYKTNLQDTIEHIIQLAYDHEIIKSNIIKVDFSKKD
ncbi:hypothetical protein DM558_02755 [Entomomonas moraniae]|uniref:Uncharacterized protein n=1 Tax=Entomomonas moraniae TaxID=2213226 RepID=A0A3S9XBH4_9GAMM|nr:hypothetical protein [Entomomonas moraniae]AZS49767.1 hypothetical protein DM558_02755 [Entomomonas moraniae]